MLEALRRKGKGRIVFASSGGSVYGPLRHLPVTEDHPLCPVTAYGASKAAAEMYLSLYRGLHDVDCRIARIANPFGAGQDVRRGQGAATRFLSYALSNQPIVIWGDGEVVRDYLHISDVAPALVSLATLPALSNSYIFNIGSGRGLSLNNILNEMEKEFHRKLDVQYTPGRPFDVPVSILDITLAQKVLNWTPRLSFRDAMRLTIRDLKNGALVSSCPGESARGAVE